jgi:hypothetical protein
MKRIYYGSLTIDVADDVGTVLQEVVTALADQGRQQFVTIPGYIEDGTAEASVELWVGGAFPIAVAPHFPAKPDPSDTAPQLEVLRGLAAGK